MIYYNFGTKNEISFEFKIEVNIRLKYFLI